MTGLAAVLSEPPGPAGLSSVSQLPLYPLIASPETKAIAKASHVIRLGPDWYEALLGLNQAVRDALPEEKKHHLKEILPGDLATHFGEAVGIVTPQRQLIGGMLVTYKHPGASRVIPGHPADTITQDTAIFRSLMIQPAFAGCKLAPRVIALGQQLAIAAGKDQGIARISITNRASEAAFAKKGFEPASDAFFDDTAPKPYWLRYWKCDLKGGPG